MLKWPGIISFNKIIEFINRLPQSPETMDAVADIGEGLIGIVQNELELNHEYCSALQDLRQMVRQVHDVRGGADHQVGRRIEIRRRLEAHLAAQRHADVCTILHH